MSFACIRVNFVSLNMKVLNFALIGAGKFGKNYIRLLRETDGAFLHTVVVKSSKSARELRKTLPPEIKISTDAEKALRNKKIDCVIIATPPATHFKLIRLAANCQKHIMVEKPMVKNLREAKKLKIMLKNYKPVFMVGYQYIYNDYINYLRKKILDGSFGRIQFMLGEHIKSPPRNDTGAFMDAGCHFLSIAKYLLNQGRITTISGAFQKLRNGKYEFFASVSFKSAAGGATVSIITSWPGPVKTRKLVVMGEKMSAVLDETLDDNKLKIFLNDGNKPVIAPKIKIAEPLKKEIMHFIDCVKHGKKPITDFNFGYAINDWMAKAYMKT